MLGTIPTIGIVFDSIISLLGLVWLVSQGEPMILFTQGINQGELLMFLASLLFIMWCLNQTLVDPITKLAITLYPNCLGRYFIIT